MPDDKPKPEPKPPEKRKQNTELGAVGTFKVRGKDGKDIEFKAKTTGIVQ